MQRSTATQEKKSLFPVPVGLKSNFAALNYCVSPLQKPTAVKKSQGLSPIKLPKPVDVGTTVMDKKLAFSTLSPLSKPSTQPKSVNQENMKPAANTGSKLNDKTRTDPRKREIVIPTRVIDPVIFDQTQKTLKEKELQVIKLSARVSEYESTMGLMKEELQRKNHSISTLQHQITDKEEHHQEETAKIQNEHQEKLQWKDRHISDLNQQIESFSVDSHKANDCINQLKSENLDLQEQLFNSIALCMKVSFTGGDKSKRCNFSISTLRQEAIAEKVKCTEFAEWIAERVAALYKEQNP